MAPFLFSYRNSLSVASIVVRCSPKWGELMQILERLKERARKHSPRIVLPEGEDDRIIQAAVRAAAEGYAKPTLLGREDVIRASAHRRGENLDGIEIIDVASSPQLDTYARIYFERRRA